MARDLSRWADSAMYRSEPMPRGDDYRVRPTATVLNATPDPLGTVAAVCGVYSGRVVRDLSEISDDERRQAFTDMLATELQGPLEVAQFTFLIEGVSRSWTHQAVRERGAFFAQESMRFAVVEGEDWTDRSALPPSIQEGSLAYAAWDRAVTEAEDCYTEMINLGVPAEDARSVMPHAMTTRLFWTTDLRGLLHVAGLRLCTQAQFEWRAVMAEVVKALRQYASGPAGTGPDEGGYCDAAHGEDAWQFGFIADQLRPVCYQKGQCGFMAKFDRNCTIRERVEMNARAGRPSAEWNQKAEVVEGGAVITIEGISNAEWAADPAAARRAQWTADSSSEGSSSEG
jgi:thymidylate synthase (FAD)